MKKAEKIEDIEFVMPEYEFNIVNEMPAAFQDAINVAENQADNAPQNEQNPYEQMYEDMKRAIFEANFTVRKPRRARRREDCEIYLARDESGIIYGHFSKPRFIKLNSDDVGIYKSTSDVFRLSKKAHETFKDLKTSDGPMLYTSKNLKELMEDE